MIHIQQERDEKNQWLGLSNWVEISTRDYPGQLSLDGRLWSTSPVSAAWFGQQMQHVDSSIEEIDWSGGQSDGFAKPSQTSDPKSTC